MGDFLIKHVVIENMENTNQQKNKAGVHRPIICKKCGHKVGFLRMTPVMKEILDKKNRKETWLYIFMIAMITQIVSQILSDLLLGHFGFR